MPELSFGMYVWLTNFLRKNIDKDLRIFLELPMSNVGTTTDIFDIFLMVGESDYSNLS